MTIKEIQAGSGESRWRVSYEFDGRSVRKKFKTEHEARDFAAQRAKSQGQIMDSIINLRPAQQALLMEAYELADRNNLPLYECVRYYMAEHGGVTREKIRDAVPRFLATKESLRHKSRQSLRSLLEVFVLRHGSLELGQIDKATCHDFLFSDPAHSPNTIRGYKTRLGTFFNWAIDNGLLMRNPVQAIKVAGGGRKPITFFNTAQAHRLLITAKNTDPGMVPLLALGMFAGIRLGEMRGQIDKRGMTWDEVYLDRPDPELEVADEVGKTGRRMVPISPNLKRWLERGGDLYPIVNHRKRLETIRGLAELGELGQWEWDSSIMRHTFATMHVAQHKNPDHTRYIMGHEEKSQVFTRHYDGRVSPNEAVEFWSITP